MTVPLVLLYHGFGERSPGRDPHNLFVPDSALEDQLTSLLARGYRPLDEASFVAGLTLGRWPRRTFLITIDDGYVSTLHVAAPVLARLDVPAVLFALPGRLGGTSAWMDEMPDEALLDADQLRELPRFGVSVASHGMDHRSMIGLERDELKRQTSLARTALADVTGRVPRLFAYPFGDHDAAARKAVDRAGFSAAFAIYRRGGMFALPRVDVNALDTPRSFRVKTSGLYSAAKIGLDRAPAIRRLGHALVGKAARR